MTKVKKYVVLQRRQELNQSTKRSCNRVEKFPSDNLASLINKHKQTSVTLIGLNPLLLEGDPYEQ
jgi:hypothetical protein